MQDKISGQMLNIPVQGRSHAYILKLNPPEFPHLVENEAFFFRAAAHTRLRLANVELVHDKRGAPGLLVNRFDRIPEGDIIRPLAVEDACQVLGRWPGDKYVISTEDAIAGLARCCGALVKPSVFPDGLLPTSSASKSQLPRRGSRISTNSPSTPTQSATCTDLSTLACVTFSPGHSRRPLADTAGADQADWPCSQSETQVLSHRHGRASVRSTDRGIGTDHSDLGVATGQSQAAGSAPDRRFAIADAGNAGESLSCVPGRGEPGGPRVSSSRANVSVPARRTGKRQGPGAAPARNPAAASCPSSVNTGWTAATAADRPQAPSPDSRTAEARRLRGRLAGHRPAAPGLLLTA